MKQKPESIRKILLYIIYIKRGLAAGITLALILGFYANPIAVGQNLDELQQMRQDKQKQLDAINSKIGAIQTDIKATKTLTQSLNNEIKLLNLEIAETEAQLESTRLTIDATNLEIAVVTENIVRTEQEIRENKENLKGLIRQIYELEELSPLEIALEHDNLTDFIDQLEYTSNIQEQTSDILITIKDLKAELEQRQLDLKKEKSKLDNLLRQLEIAQVSLQVQRGSKQQLLDQTRGQERRYQQLLAEQEGLEEQISREIFDLEVEIRQKLGNRRLPAHKGLLAWPMDGVLTQGYGNTGFTSLGYNFHNGLDIAGPAGTPIYAVADGVVIDAGTGQGAYGNWLTIKHKVTSGGRALISLYAHLSSFSIQVGQQVIMGDLVGFEGNTGNTTRLLYGSHRGYHLHFTLFDEEGYGVAAGQYTKIFGPYRVPYGYTYNPLEFL